MATRGSRTDKYSNLLSEQVTTSAANTLTFEEIDVGLNLFDKVGLLISRWEVYPFREDFDELETNADSMSVALVASNQISSLSATERAVIDNVRYAVADSGTPATANLQQVPMVKDFANLPGGGILVAPKPLYVGIDTTGFAGSAGVDVRLYFTIVSLKPEEYFELLESRRFFG
jgi:hypothetical protein